MKIPKINLFSPSQSSDQPPENADPMATDSIDQSQAPQSSEQEISQLMKEEAYHSGLDSPISSQATHDEAEASHFDDLINSAEHLDQQGAPEIPSHMLSREDFTKLFIGGHKTAAMLTAIKSLEIPNSHVDQGTGEAAAGALYDTIIDIPALHFMLQPQNKWLERMWALGMYAYGMKQALKAEAMQRRAMHEAAKEAANFTKAKQTVKDMEERYKDGNPTPEQAEALGA